MLTVEEYKVIRRKVRDGMSQREVSIFKSNNFIDMIKLINFRIGFVNCYIIPPK
jgi:hypothetical protein